MIPPTVSSSHHHRSGVHADSVIFPSRYSATYAEQGTAGVSADNFLVWAQKFTSCITHLTQDGRKVLLLYDAYRSHTTLRVQEHLRENGAIVSRLLALSTHATTPVCSKAWNYCVCRNYCTVTSQQNARALKVGRLRLYST